MGGVRDRVHQVDRGSVWAETIERGGPALLLAAAVLGRAGPGRAVNCRAREEHGRQEYRHGQEELHKGTVHACTVRSLRTGYAQSPNKTGYRRYAAENHQHQSMSLPQRSHIPQALACGGSPSQKHDFRPNWTCNCNSICQGQAALNSLISWIDMSSNHRSTCISPVKLAAIIGQFQVMNMDHNAR